MTLSNFLYFVTGNNICLSRNHSFASSTNTQCWLLPISISACHLSAKFSKLSFPFSAVSFCIILSRFSFTLHYTDASSIVFSESICRHTPLLLPGSSSYVKKFFILRWSTVLCFKRNVPDSSYYV